MQFKDYYETLGVESSAGEAEIKTAYRRLARKFHPDVSKEAGAEERFKAVNEAYEVLRDKEKRTAYDQLRARGYRPGEEFRPPPDFGDRFGAGGQGGFQYEEGFGGGEGFSDFFESLFGGGRAPGAGPRAGAAG
jgi:curved DNA-binding protein